MILNLIEPLKYQKTICGAFLWINRQTSEFDSKNFNPPGCYAEENLKKFSCCKQNSIFKNYDFQLIAFTPSRTVC